jgi:hypothetical protein
MAKQHALVYLGFFDTSFHRLTPKQDRYWKKGESAESSGRAVERPGRGVKGVVFGYMERPGKSFAIVRINELVLRAPVLFIGGRHGPAAPGPVSARLDDDDAAHILVDAVVANPECRDMLANMLRLLG